MNEQFRKQISLRFCQFIFQGLEKKRSNLFEHRREGTLFKISLGSLHDLLLTRSETAETDENKF